MYYVLYRSTTKQWYCQGLTQYHRPFGACSVIGSPVATISGDYTSNIIQHIPADVHAVRATMI